MRETLLGKLVLVLSRATPEKLAAVYQFATGESIGELRELGRTPKSGGAGTSAEGQVEGKPRYVFRWTGRDWEVIFGGGKPFYLEDTLAAKCAHYLLHNPNGPITALDLELQAQPEKGTARASNSVQADSDPRALREYREELSRLRAEKGRVQAAAVHEGAGRLEEDIRALEAALRGGGPPDAGERAYDNVRKSFRVLMERLRQAGPEQRAFGEHLSTHLSIGFECLYSQPEGRIWA